MVTFLLHTQMDTQMDVDTTFLGAPPAYYPASDSSNDDGSYIDPLQLPDEIAAHIFAYASQVIVENDSFSFATSPLVFGHVCRAWRAIAWSSSELWTTPVIMIRKLDLSLDLRFLPEWIARANGRLLDIYLDASAANREFFLRPLQTQESRIHVKQRDLLLNFLAHTCTYWRTIHLKGLPNMWGKKLDLALKSNPSQSPIFPALRHVTISHNNVKPPSDTTHVPMIDFTSAPCLRSAEFAWVARFVDVSTAVQSTRITHLSLVHLHSYAFQWRELMDNYPNLVELSLNDVSMKRPSQQGRIEHRKLKKLCLEVVSWQSLAPLIHPLSFHTLSELYLKLTKSDLGSLRLHSFIEHSAQSLTVLRLECYLPPESELIDLLYIMSTLIEVHIKDLSPLRPPDFDGLNVDTPALSRVFFDVLHPDDDPTYLPKLEVLSFEGALSVQAIDFLEPALIRARVRPSSELDAPVSTLRRLTIKADQYSMLSQFSISEYSDPQYIWEVIRMMELGIMILVNKDGESWE